MEQIYKTTSHPLENIDPLNPNKKISLITSITDKEILNIISDLNIRESTGPNNIPTKVMNKIIDVISAPYQNLAKLINRYFHNGAFPNILKIAKVISANCKVISEVIPN